MDSPRRTFMSKRFALTPTVLDGDLEAVRHALREGVRYSGFHNNLAFARVVDPDDRIEVARKVLNLTRIGEASLARAVYVGDLASAINAGEFTVDDISIFFDALLGARATS